MVTVLVLVVVMLTVALVPLLATADRMTLLGEAFRMLLLPPPPVEVVYVTLIVAPVAPVGAVGVSVTVADDPEGAPGLILKIRDVGVVRPFCGSTFSHVAEPVLIVKVIAALVLLFTGIASVNPVNPIVTAD
jgi:hypothetical protein